MCRNVLLPSTRYHALQPARPFWPELAGAKGHSVAQLALAWLLHQKAVSSVIVGAKRPDQLADNLGAVDVAFSTEELARLDAVSKLTAEYPDWMLERRGGYRGGPSPRR